MKLVRVANSNSCPVQQLSSHWLSWSHRRHASSVGPRFSQSCDATLSLFHCSSGCFFFVSFSHLKCWDPWRWWHRSSSSYHFTIPGWHPIESDRLDSHLCAGTSQFGIISPAFPPVFQAHNRFAYQSIHFNPLNALMVLSLPALRMPWFPESQFQAP